MQLTESPIKSLFSSLLKKRFNLSTPLFELQPGLIATIKVKETTVFFTAMITIKQNQNQNQV